MELPSVNTDRRSVYRRSNRNICGNNGDYRTERTRVPSDSSVNTVTELRHVFSTVTEPANTRTSTDQNHHRPVLKPAQYPGNILVWGFSSSNVPSWFLQNVSVSKTVPVGSLLFLGTVLITSKEQLLEPFLLHLKNLCQQRSNNI